MNFIVDFILGKSHACYSTSTYLVPLRNEKSFKSLLPRRGKERFSFDCPPSNVKFDEKFYKRILNTSIFTEEWEHSYLRINRP